MRRKKYLVAALVLNIGLLAFAAAVGRSWQAQRGCSDPKTAPLAGPVGKFGPVIETVLPASTDGTSVDIVDLESRCARRPPTLEYFNSRADALMAWIKANGLDISCSLWPGGASCVTYDMIVVPVEAKYWEQTTEQELLDNPALAPVAHAPRRLLVLGNGLPNTYIFRTGKGTLGMLRLVGLSEHGRGVKLRYKLINPAKSVASLLPSSSSKG